MKGLEYQAGAGMSNVTRLRRPVVNLVRIPAQIDGNVLVSKLARALASEGLTLSNQRDGSLLIHELPPFLRTSHGESIHE